MAEPPRLGPPTAITTHEDGRFSVEFVWTVPPDNVWLKAATDLMRRSGRDSVQTTAEWLTITFHPQDAEASLDDLGTLLEDADRMYHDALEQREAAISHVREALLSRFGEGPELPVREA